MEEGENVSDYVTRINGYLKTIQKNLIDTRENGRAKNVERLTAQMKALNQDQPIEKIKEKVEEILPRLDARDTIYAKGKWRLWSKQVSKSRART